MMTIKKLAVGVLFLIIISFFCTGCDLTLEDDPYVISKINGFWHVDSIVVENGDERNTCMIPQSIIEIQQTLQNGMDIYADFVDGYASGYYEYDSVLYAIDTKYTYQIDDHSATFDTQNTSPGIFKYIFRSFVFDVTEETLSLYYDISLISGCEQNKLVIYASAAEKSLKDKAQPVNEESLELLK